MSKKSLLWKISAQNSEQSSYLLGTMHVKDQLAFHNIDTIHALLKEVQQLYLEIDLSTSAHSGVQQHFYLPEGKQLSDYLGSKKYDKYRAIFIKAYQFDIEPNRFLKPILISNALAESFLQENNSSTLDQHLFEYAQSIKLPSFGLETIQYHYDILAKVPIDKQFTQLKQIARNPAKYRRQVMRLTDYYRQADLHTLYRMSKDSLSEIKKIMLYERNQLMLSKMNLAIMKAPTLFAVGAAHLGGKAGLIALLKSKGFSVRPIMMS